MALKPAYKYSQVTPTDNPNQFWSKSLMNKFLFETLMMAYL